MAALSGNTGNVSGNGIVGTLNTWSCTISRAVADVTGFNNSGRNRLLGVYDLTGSAGGVLDTNASMFGSNQPAAMTAVTGGAITLSARAGVAVTNHIVATCVVNDLSINVNKTGDATVTFDFSLAATATGTDSPFTIVWSA
jgi:hypothetical protein